jgi:hypothetical protein
MLPNIGSPTKAQEVPEMSPTEEPRQRSKREQSLLRTLQLIRDPKSNAIYTMKNELRFITEHNIEQLKEALDKMALHENIKFSALVELMTHHLGLMLFGCSIDIGICTDSSAKVIEFFADPNYRRKVARGESNCFLALDREDVVVEGIRGKNNPLVNVSQEGGERGVRNS